MKKLTLFVCLLLCAAILPHKAFAGLPIGKYRKLVVPSFSYYRQTNRFDLNGNYVKGTPGTSFASYSANLYLGYGITRRLDFVANVPYLYQVNQFTAVNKIINQGAGDLTAGFVYNLANFNYVRYFSVQVSGIVPLYKSTNGNSALGVGSYGSEVKFSFTGNLPKVILEKGFFNTELAYRRYFNNQGPDQVSFLGTIGYAITKHNQVSLDLLLFRSFSSNKTFNNNIFAARDFAFFKPAVNFGRTITRRCSIFIGGFYVPIGINTGVGYGGQALLVFKL